MRRRRGRPPKAPPEPVMVQDVEPISTEQYPTARKKRKDKPEKPSKKRPVNIIVQPGAKVEVKS